MSTQRGNVKRERPQKHQNKSAFKNTMHDKSKRTQQINSIQPTGCCNKCKEIIEWRIKYKKYKLLSQPKKCVKCEQKTVKKSYSTVCDGCAKEKGICVKCGLEKEIAVPHGLTSAEEASHRSQLDNELKLLSERERRTFYRSQESGKLGELHEGRAKEMNAAAASADGLGPELSDSEDDLSDLCENEDDLSSLTTKMNRNEDQPEEKLPSSSVGDMDKPMPSPSTSS